MADVKRIRDRLLSLGQEAERLLGQRQGPPPHARVQFQHVAGNNAQARQDAAEERASRLESALAEAELAAEQARVGRDRDRAELEAARAELEQVRAELEAARGRELESAADSGRSERKDRKLRATKRIAALEGELESERKLRQDAQLTLERLQREREEASPQDVVTAPEAPPDDPPQDPPEDPRDGWGKPLEAFPLDAARSEHSGGSSGAGAGGGRRSRLRPGRRHAS